MPKRRARKRVAKRRGRKKSKVSNVLVCYGPKVIPDRYRCKMTYKLTKTLTAAVSDTIMRGNSVFDPEYVVGGGQPNGFDELAGLYERYCVNGASIKVVMVNHAASAARLTVVCDPDAALITNGIEAGSKPYAKSTIIAPNGSGRSLQFLKMYMSTKAARGLRRGSQIVDDELEATTTTNPAKQWFFHVVSGHMDGITTSSHSLDIEITYYVDFFKRRPLGDA